MVAVPSIGRASQVTPRRAAPEADATRDLYERYARQIYAYCHHQLGNREEAEDATQSTFLNAFRGFKRGVDPEFESAWLYKIAQNVCLTRQRSSSRRRRVESPGDLDAIQDILPSNEVDSDELIGLPEALQNLPKQQQRALLLREWQGLSYKEIAEELDLTQAAVETLLFRARRSLAAGLSDDSAKSKSVVSKLRAGTDAGSALALLKTLLSFGGAKAAATVATVAATSVVAATPTARHAVEHAVAPAKPHHVAPAAHLDKPLVAQAAAAGAATTAVAHTPSVAHARSATASSAKRTHLYLVSAHHTSLPVGPRPRASATPDATTRPAAPVAPVAEAPQPTPSPAPAPTEPVVDLPPAAVAVPPAPAPPATPAPPKREETSTGSDTKSGHGDRTPDKHGRRVAQAAQPPVVTPPAVTPPVVTPPAVTPPAAPAPATNAQTPAPPASTPTLAWQPPGNVEKMEAREARKGKGRRDDAQNQQPPAAAPAVPAGPAPVAPTAPAVAVPAPAAATTPAPAEDSTDRGARGPGHRK